MGDGLSITFGELNFKLEHENKNEEKGNRKHIENRKEKENKRMEIVKSQKNCQKSTAAVGRRHVSQQSHLTSFKMIQGPHSSPIHPQVHVNEIEH